MQELATAPYQNVTDGTCEKGGNPAIPIDRPKSAAAHLGSGAMELLTLAELKTLCLARALPISGNKSELIERLAATAAASKPAAAAGIAARYFPDDYDALAIAQLKDLCRDRALPVAGIKDDLVARLKASDPRYMTLAQLKDKCRDAGEVTTGSKQMLVDRLMRLRMAGIVGDLGGKSVEELKAMCREHGVGVSGKKEDLIQRLMGDAASERTISTTAAPTRGIATVAANARASNEKNALSTSAADTSKPMTVANVAALWRDTGFKLNGPKDKHLAKLPLTSLNVNELKDLCRRLSLSVGGNRSDLLERLTTRSTPAATPALPVSTSSAIDSSSVQHTAPQVPTLSQLKAQCRDRTLPMTGSKEDLIERLRVYEEMTRQTFGKKRKGPPSTASDGSASPSIATATAGAAPRRIVTANLKGKKKASVPAAVGSAIHIAARKTCSSSTASGISSGAAARRDNNASTAAAPRHTLQSMAARKTGPRVTAAELASNAREGKRGVSASDYPWLGPQMARKSTGGKAPRSAPSNVNAARKSCSAYAYAVSSASGSDDSLSPASPPYKQARRRAEPASRSSSSGEFVVYSKHGDSSAADSLEIVSHGKFTSRVDANKQVRSMFYEENPWDWDERDFDGVRGSVSETFDDGMLTLSIRQPDDEEWSVWATAAPTPSRASVKRESTSRSSAKSKSAATRPTSSGTFIVFSRQRWIPDGFHSYQGPGEILQHGVLPSAEAANERARQIFYQNHPCGLSPREMRRLLEIDERVQRGMLTITSIDNGEEWTVGVRGQATNDQTGSTNASSANSAAPRYVVYTRCGYEPDGFHSYQGDTLEFDRVFTSKAEANQRVEHVFFANNPWGLDRDEFFEPKHAGRGGYYERRNFVHEEVNDGLRTLWVHPDDSERWEVVAVAESTANPLLRVTDHDGDAVMDSGSETDDDYERGL